MNLKSFTLFTVLGQTFNVVQSWSTWRGSIWTKVRARRGSPSPGSAANTVARMEGHYAVLNYQLNLDQQHAAQLGASWR